MLLVIVSKIIGIVLIADNEHLHKTQQRISVAVADIIFVVYNLLHSAARANIQSLQFNLHHRQTIDKQNNIIPLETIPSVDAQLVNHLIIVFAPIFYVYEHIL